MERTTRPSPSALPALPRPLADLLRQERQRQQLSLLAVAQRCTQLCGRRVTPQYLSNLERGHRVPSLPLLQVLAIVLALEPAALGVALLQLLPLAAPTPPADGTPALALPNLLTHVQHAAQHVAHTQQTYRTLLCTAYQAGYSLRQLAAATGRSPSRIRQLVATPSPAPAPPSSRA